jgi:MOSC domain-containing protein
MAGITLTGITIYPVKGTAGISLRKAHVQERGLEWDRRCMVVDSQNTCMTQRVFPRLALIRVAVEEHGLVVSAAGMQPHRLPIPDAGSISVRVWDDTVDALTFSGETDKWFSTFLRTPCRLVYMPDSTRRMVDPSRTPAGQVVSFADAYPFLILSEESLDLLNRKLPGPVSMNRFRPNIVVAGCDPHGEDSWHHISIGSAEFLIVKPCARCVVTTVEQETAIKGQEPLRTLATYRQFEGKVLFGENMISTVHGTITVGDPVTVLS